MLEEVCHSLRVVAQISKGWGERVTPKRGFSTGSTPGGVEKLKRCMKQVKKRKSSIRARFSPRHKRLPAAKSQNNESSDNLPVTR